MAASQTSRAALPQSKANSSHVNSSPALRGTAARSPQQRSRVRPDTSRHVPALGDTQPGQGTPQGAGGAPSRCPKAEPHASSHPTAYTQPADLALPPCST